MAKRLGIVVAILIAYTIAIFVDAVIEELRPLRRWVENRQAPVEGEFQKGWNAKQFYPPETRRLLFTVIVGQRCAAGDLDDGFASPRFEQRSFPAPESWIELCKDVFL